VDYLTSNGHIEELSVQGFGNWAAADLTTLAHAPAAVGNPDGFQTTLSGQGPVARVDYLTSNGHIEELYVQGSGDWAAADLTALTNAPAAVGNPVGFQTTLTGQGPTARVDYRTSNGHIEELSVTGSPGNWTPRDLTTIAHAPAAVGNPTGFQTTLTGQNPTARVDYRTSNSHIEGLSVTGTNPQHWTAKNLTALTNAPAAVGDPHGFQTTLTGQNPTARVDYLTSNGHIEEISAA
jgi:hypothetical protein